MAGRTSFQGGRSRFTKEHAVKWVFFLCASVSVLTTIAIILTLLTDAVSFFTQVSPISFFTGTSWNPGIRPFSFGVLPLITGTLIVTVGSALIAVPVGVATAIYLSEYADERVRRVVKPVLEILAGIPTVVYGFFALTFITPLLKQVFPQTSTFNAASASIVVGIMIIPMVSSLSEDAMSAVPDSLRQAAYGVGATKYEVSTSVVVPASLSGILSAFILALSRAIGETMAVTLAAGRRSDRIVLNPLNSIETMTAAMVEVVTGENAAQSIQYKSMFAIGLTLFAITLLMNVLSNYVRSRYREVYE